MPKKGAVQPYFGLAALAEISRKLALLGALTLITLIFPNGGKLDLKICRKNSFNVLHVCPTSHNNTFWEKNK
jgi:hypothetical protein